MYYLKISSFYVIDFLQNDNWRQKNKILPIYWSEWETFFRLGAIETKRQFY